MVKAGCGDQLANFCSSKPEEVECKSEWTSRQIQAHSLGEESENLVMGGVMGSVMGGGKAKEEVWVLAQAAGGTGCPLPRQGTSEEETQKLRAGAG